MTTARTMTSRKLDKTADAITREIIHAAFTRLGRTRLALTAAYAAVACSDAFETVPPGSPGRPETREARTEEGG